jgi:hypothetical protein
MGAPRGWGPALCLCGLGQALLSSHCARREAIQAKSMGPSIAPTRPEPLAGLDGRGTTGRAAAPRRLGRHSWHSETWASPGCAAFGSVRALPLHTTKQGLLCDILRIPSFAHPSATPANARRQHLGSTCPPIIDLPAHFRPPAPRRLGGSAGGRPPGASRHSDCLATRPSGGCSGPVSGNQS